jgi:ectoine hydroxylase-related dioxygenase (phytanoyl-CoA dioxygenase family)
MAEGNLRALSQQQVDKFWQAGFLAVEDVLPEDQIGLLAERADQIASGQATHINPERVQLEKRFREGGRPAADGALAARKLYWLAGEDDVLGAHARNPRIVDIIADLYASDDLKLYADQLFMKPPEYGAAQHWHQDSASFKDIYPMNLITAWTAIDDATTENGCLEFVPGSHQWGVLRKTWVEDLVPALGQAPDYPVVPVPLRSGSVSFHHSLTLHASRENQSTTRRRGYATHYMKATSRRDGSIADAPQVPPFMQVRGRSFPECV